MASVSQAVHLLFATIIVIMLCCRLLACIPPHTLKPLAPYPTLTQAFGFSAASKGTSASESDDGDPAGLLLRTAIGAIEGGGGGSGLKAGVERLQGVTSAVKDLMGVAAGSVGDIVEEWHEEVLEVLEQAPMVGVAFTLIKKLVGRGKQAKVCEVI